MHPNYFEQWPKAKNFSLEPIMELNGITTKLCSEIAKENFQAMNEWMQSMTEHTQNLSRVKGIEEFMELQSRFASKTTPQICQHAQHVLDTMMESASEYNKWFEKGFSEFSKESKVMQEKVHEKFKQAQGHHSK
jgi:phasin family protein